MKIAIVIPWFGRDLKGGAEQQAWQIAARLAQRGHTVEVLTTCCRSHQDDWATNHLAKGQLLEPEGFVIRRFAVERRDKQRFDQVCAYLMNIPQASLVPGVSPVSEAESAVFVNELIKSPRLETFLREHRTAFAAFIFLPYLYGPILRGVSAVADRACLQPCLHNEAYAYLPQVAHAFFQAASVFFNSEGEAELAARLYGPAVLPKSIIMGEGVEMSVSSSADTPPPRNDRFVLYLGRKESGKNTDMLVRAFARFRRVRPNSALRLVFAGHGKIEADGALNWIDDLGVVSDAEKERLLGNCLALAQPSKNESFSRAIMEAWRHGKPVAVHRACLATATEVKRADGGWLPESEDEWAAWFVQLDRAPLVELQRLGRNGIQHAEVVSDWEQVMQRYEQAFAAIARKTQSGSRAAQSKCTINQLLPNLSHGDAISNYAVWIRNQLRYLGYQSNIFVRFIDPRVAHECQLFSPELIRRSDALIYHHSIGSEITPHIIAFAGPKCLIYHNITPAELVEPYRPEFAQMLRAGREQLQRLAPDFKTTYAVSEYNAAELRRFGFAEPDVLPIPFDPERWALTPDEALMRKLHDGRTNILFVGRIAANKKQDDLVRAFVFYLQLDPQARLFLIGATEKQDPYAEHVLASIRNVGLEGRVVLRDNVTDAELLAYYRTATLFWSMSEHEGFCVPLLEAMWFDVPILAYNSSAIPETLGKAALLFDDKSRLEEVAALAHLLATDADLRTVIIRMQRARRDAFLPQRIRPMIKHLAHKLGNTRKRYTLTARASDFAAQHCD